MAVIEYRDVYKAFDVPVLTGVDLTVASGETLSIVGPSGTGKSVLLKTTIALIVPDKGDVFIDGQSVVSAGRDQLQEIRRKAGYVFQNAALFDSMNVYENVSLGLSDAMIASLGRAEVLRRVAGALEDVNLDASQVMNKLPAELSGGMRKLGFVGTPDEFRHSQEPLVRAFVDREAAFAAAAAKSEFAHEGMA